MSTKSAQLLDYIDQHARARTDEMAEALQIPMNTVSALLARYVLDNTLVSCRVERPGLPPVNEYRRSVAGGGRTTEFRDMCGRRDHMARFFRDAAPQPSTAAVLAAPSHEGAGQGDAADAASPKNGSAVLDDAYIAQGMARAERDHAQPELAHDSLSCTREELYQVLSDAVNKEAFGELSRTIRSIALWQTHLITGWSASSIYSTASRNRVGLRLVVTPEGIRVWRVR